MLDQVRAEFNGYLKKTFGKNQEVLKALLLDDKKKRCIEATCEEIKKCEASVALKMKFDISRFKFIIHECAKMYAQAWLKHQEERALSYAEKQKRIFEADTVKRAEETMIDLDDEATTKKLISRPGDIAR